MKNILNILLYLGLTVAFSSCIENNILPDYTKLGTSTATVASISASNDEVAVGETITLTLSYVNRADDPASQIEVLIKVGSGDFTTLTTLDESSATPDTEVTRTVSYTVPAGTAPGTDIDFDMVLTTTKEYPQRERESIEVI